MSHVYVTTYEIIGAGVAMAKEYHAEIHAAKSAQWAFATALGGVGVRPNRAGGLRSVFFMGAAPKGWRKIGQEGDRIECLPRKSTKDGKAIEAEIAALPMAPQSHILASKLGYAPPHMAIAGGKIYFATDLHVCHPTDRYFIRLPRFPEDGFEPDEAIVRALPESEFMKAIEDHNAEAKHLREAEGDGHARRSIEGEHA